MISRLAPRVRVKAWLTRFVSVPLAKMFLALHVSPNALTLTGLAVAAVVAYLLSEGRFLLGGIVLLFGAAADMLDGTLARLSDRVSRLGALLDSVVDRLSEAMVLGGLMVYYVEETNELGAYLCFASLVASMMVSYVKARSEGLGVTVDVGIMGRAERVVVLVIGLLFGYPLVALGIILFLASVTVVHRTIHAAQQMKG